MAAPNYLLLLGILAILTIAFARGRLVRLDPVNPEIVALTGEKINLRCIPDFDAETTWYKNEQALRHSTARIRVTKQMLRIKHVEVEDAASYSCRIASSHKLVHWRNVTLRVETPQSDDAYRRDQQNDEEEEEEQQQQQQPLPRSRSRADPKVAALDTNELEIESRNLPETRSLHLDNERTDFESEYERTGDNETAGERNKTAPESPPSFNKTDEMHPSIVKPAGNMLRLKCPSVGNPRPNITWLKNNEEPKRSLGTMIKTKWTLRLEDLVPTDSGNYTCIVCNHLACINHTFKVEIIETVKHRPILTRPPRNTTVLIGSNASMTCKVLSDAHRHLEWYHGYHTSFDTVNKTNQTVRVEVKESSGGTENPEVLWLYNVTEKDEGWYTCIAQNTLGETFSSAYLRVVENEEISGESDPAIDIHEEGALTYNVTTEEKSREVDRNSDRKSTRMEASEETNESSPHDALQAERKKLVAYKKNMSQEDEYSTFGRLVAAKLRKMNPQQRLYAENLIGQVLFQGSLARLSEQHFVHPYGYQHQHRQGNKNLENAATRYAYNFSSLM